MKKDNSIIPKGTREPLTVTQSIFLICFYNFSVKISLRGPLTNNPVPNYLVAASNLEAILTLGLK